MLQQGAWLCLGQVVAAVILPILEDIVVRQAALALSTSKLFWSGRRW